MGAAPHRRQAPRTMPLELDDGQGNVAGFRLLAEASNLRPGFGGCRDVMLARETQRDAGTEPAAGAGDEDALSDGVYSVLVSRIPAPPKTDQSRG